MMFAAIVVLAISFVPRRENYANVRHATRSSQITLRRNGKAVARGAIQGPIGNDGAGGEDIDWYHPFADTAAVPTLANAAANVPFKPVAPSLLGAPQAISVHALWRPNAVALVYDNPPLGRFNIIEEPPTLTQKILESIPLRCHPEQGCEGSWTIVTLEDGTRALAVNNPRGVDAMQWLHGDIQFSILGPGDTFSLGTAEAVANIIEQAVH